MSRTSSQRWLLACLSCACWSSAALAQTEPAPAAPSANVRWSDIPHLVHDVSPRVAALRGQVRVAEAGIRVAGVLPNPSLDYTGFGRLGHGDQYGTQHQIGLEMPLWLAGQRGARVRSAEGRADVARAEAATTEAELQASAQHAWLALLAAQARVVALEKALVDVTEIARIVRERVAAGAESPYDEARVNLELSQVDTRLAAERGEQIEAAATFADVLGVADWQPVAVGELSPLGIAAEFPALWQTALGKLPALAAAERSAAVAASDIETARAERWPVPTVSAGTFLTTDNKSTALFVGVSAPLPLFDFGGASIDQAKAALAASQSERTAALQAARSHLAGSIGALTAKRAALASYESGVNQHESGLREMARAAYQSGAANVLELLDSTRVSIEVALEHIELTRSVVDSELDVLAAAGLLTEPPKR